MDGNDGHEGGIIYGEDNVECEEESVFHDDPGRQRRHRSNVTMLEFVAFRLHSRADSLEIGGNRVLLFRKLTQEYMVDMFGSIEFQRLDWLRYHQTELCADLYQGLQDAMTRHDTDGHGIGRCIILPSSFAGGARCMLQLYQDAMAIVRHHGKPDYFITMTCNPNWMEVQDALLSGQRSHDRLDLTT